MWPFRKQPKQATPALQKVKLEQRRIVARFDASTTTADNAKHWAAAEFLSADAEADASVRTTLRTRARYEVQNNTYARGIVLTLANDSVGTGPRLQMLTNDEGLNRRLEHDFALWAKRIKLAQKLRTIRMARCQDGEAFVLLAQNPNIEGDVKLDLQLIEADQVTDISGVVDEKSVDGITFDAFGNPLSYKVLRHHPGGAFGYSTETMLIPAKNMIHIFRQDRPGQHRGIPEITSALPLFAQLRRFTLAVLSAAEAAADFAGILYTDSPANGEASDVDPMDSIQLERNMLLTMPGGWKMSQLDPKQPATTYAEFKHEILNEIARCLNMPYNIAACNSSGYNYSSGRLDHQTYYKSIRVEQAFVEEVILDRVLELWLKEWLLSTQTTDLEGECLHTWFWDGMEHVDPAKEANAQATRLASHTTTLAAEYARVGKDWDTELRQIAKEQELMRKLNIQSAESITQNKEEDNAE